MFTFPEGLLKTLSLRLQKAHAQAVEQVSERAKEKGQQLLLKFAIAEENERQDIIDFEQAEDRRKTWYFARLESGYEPSRPKSEQVRLANEIAVKTYNALKANSSPSWIVGFLGCSHSDLWAHLEARFMPGMTRENHGSVWEVDHIRPRSSFDLVDLEQYRTCAHFSNLQPLTIAEHKLKHSKR